MWPTLLAVFGMLSMGHGPAAAAAQVPDAREPVPRSGQERAEERQRMVEEQIAHPRDGRTPVRDRRVLAALRAVPRHMFVPPAYRPQAYDDMPLPIGQGQTISQPYIVALMTEQLRLPPSGRVLEVGSGSGYQAAVLAHLTPNVFSVEIVDALARTAQETLRDQGYATVKVRRGDGHLGWPEQAPFDGIIVTCAPEALPPALWGQLKPGGRIVIPIGAVHGIQQLVVVSKTPTGERRVETITDVRFVPMIRGMASDADPAAPSH